MPRVRAPSRVGTRRLGAWVIQFTVSVSFQGERTSGGRTWAKGRSLRVYETGSGRCEGGQGAGGGPAPGDVGDDGLDVVVGEVVGLDPPGGAAFGDEQGDARVGGRDVDSGE